MFVSRRALFIILIVMGVMCLCSANINASQKGIVRIIYTNDSRGYLEPCGCGGNFDGGFARRAAAIARLKAEVPECIILDSGNLANGEGDIGLVVKLMGQMGYSATGMGFHDLENPDLFISAAKQAKIIVIDSIGRGVDTVPYIIKTVNGVRIGVLSCRTDLKVNPFEGDIKNLGDALRNARRQSDVLVLLDQGGITNDNNWLDNFASKYGRPDVVIGGLYRAALSESRFVGATTIVPTSYQGRKLGVLDIRLEKNGPKFTARMVTLDKEIPEDAQVKAEVDDYYSKMNANMKAVPAVSRPGKQSPTYYASLLCKHCHTREYEDWAKTKHAAAIRTLVDKKRAIPECLPCHSAEYKTKGIADTESKEPMGVDCMFCHASVLPHGQSGPAEGISRKVDPKICLSCHVPDRSPKYNQKAYMQKVSHFGAAKPDARATGR